MDLFNNITFSLKYSANELSVCYRIEDLKWKTSNGELIDVDSDIINFEVRDISKKPEFLKCPVNPQQTSFKYIALPKKKIILNEVLKMIECFYCKSYKNIPGKTEGVLY